VRHPAAEIEINVEEYQQLRGEGAPYGALLRLAYAAHYAIRARPAGKELFASVVETEVFPKDFIREAIDKASSERDYLHRILDLTDDDLLIEEVTQVVSMRISLGLFGAFMLRFLATPVNLKLEGVDELFRDVRKGKKMGHAECGGCNTPRFEIDHVQNDRDMRRDIEKDLIRNEAPPLNKTHNPNWKRKGR